MHHWTRRLIAAAAPLLLTGCLWGPGKFSSDLQLRRDGSFILDYRGEMVLQMPPDDAPAQEWSDEQARCYEGVRGDKSPQPAVIVDSEEAGKVRPCTRAEIAGQKAEFGRQEAERQLKKRKESEDFAKMFGLPGLDDDSNRAFAARLMKYEGWRSVTYSGKGVYSVDYHFEGRSTQDFAFPMLPDNDFLIPFVALRRRDDGSVLITAPAMTGGAGPIAARAGSAAASGMKGGPVSRAQGRFTVITDGEVLTNNSEDGAAAHPTGRQLVWDVTPASSRIPEALIRLR